MTRRVITSTVTMLALIGLVVTGAVWGWNALFAPLPEGATAVVEPRPTCATETVGPGKKVRARQVRVSVFNAGSRSGLAGQTLDALAKRGFLPGEVGNAPNDVKVRKVQVWSSTKGDPRARLVARQFGKKVKVRFSEEDLGAGVDVVVGDRFRNLVKAPRAVAVEERQEFCLPTEPAEPVD
jgi:hypothetical protein